MLRQRLLVVAVLLPVGLVVIAAGGWLFTAVVALLLALAAAEFGSLYRRGGLRPAGPLLMLGAAAFAVARQAWGLDHAVPMLAAAAVAAMTWHLIDYERGAPRSGTDFAVTLAGIAYLGGLGAYLVSLRNLPDGLGWFLISLGAVWIGDSAAYLFGVAYGRHKMSPRLSPNKSWEGYSAGIVGAGLAGAALAAAFARWHAPAGTISPAGGLVVGVALGVLTPLGDLGISMLKREWQAKDSGSLLPGHGGALDRTDSWLWAGLLGYYLAAFLATR